MKGQVGDRGDRWVVQQCSPQEIVEIDALDC